MFLVGNEPIKHVEGCNIVKQCISSHSGCYSTQLSTDTYMSPWTPSTPTPLDRPPTGHDPRLFD